MPDPVWTVRGGAWFPAVGELVAGFLYIEDDAGNRKTLATADLDYHGRYLQAAMTTETPPVDPARYPISAPGWTLDGAAVVLPPEGGEATTTSS